MGLTLQDTARFDMYIHAYCCIWLLALLHTMCRKLLLHCNMVRSIHFHYRPKLIYKSTRFDTHDMADFYQHMHVQLLYYYIIAIGFVAHHVSYAYMVWSIHFHYRPKLIIHGLDITGHC